MTAQKKFPWTTIVKIVVSLALLGALFLFVDVRKILSAAGSFAWVWLGPVLALIAASVAVSAWKWNALLRAQGAKLTFFSAFGIYSTALFFNNFLPSSVGGDAVRIVLAGRRTGNTPAASSSVVVERTLATASLGILGLAAAALSAHAPAVAFVGLSIVAFVGIVLAGFVVSGYLPRFVREGKGKISTFLVEFTRSARTLSQKPTSLAVCLVLSFVFQIFVAAVVATVGLGFGLFGLGVFDWIFITSAASVLAMIPLGLNGYGLREGAFVFLLVPYGIEPATAVVVSVFFALSVSIYSLTGAVTWVTDRKQVAA